MVYPVFDKPQDHEAAVQDETIGRRPSTTPLHNTNSLQNNDSVPQCEQIPHQARLVG